MMQYTTAEVVDLPNGTIASIIASTIASTIVSNLDSFTFILQSFIQSLSYCNMVVMIQYTIAEVIDLPDGTVTSTILSNIDSFTLILQYSNEDTIHNRKGHRPVW